MLALLRVLEIFFHHVGHPPPQSLDKIIGIGMVSEICRLAGALKKWAAILSQWTLETVNYKKGEDQVLGALSASITPLDIVYSILSAIAPKEQVRRTIYLPTPTVEPDEGRL